MTVLRPRPAPVRPAPPAPSTRTTSQRLLGRDWRLAAVFIGPTLVLVAGLILYPILSSVLTSATERHGAETVFVGLDNYTALIDDAVFHKGVLNSFVFTAYAEIFKVVLGLIAAMILHHLRRGRALFAGVILLPWVVPTVVTAFTWRSLLDPIFGSVNVLLTDSGIGPALAAIGLVDRWPAEWLSDPALAMPAVILVNVWKGVPFFTVTFLAGLKAIDGGLYEAALVDGASPWQRFLHITLPGLRNIMIVTVLLSSIWTFNNFDLIWLMTQGGPGDATAPYVMVAYSKAIQQLQLGAGAAVTLVMLPVIAVLVVILVRLMRRSDQPSAGDLGRRRLTPAQRRAMPWVIVVASILVLVWASPHIVWKAALVLGVFVVLAAAVGRVVSTLAARGNQVAARVVGGTGTGVALAGLLGFVLAPLYWMTVTAFKSDDQIVARTDDLWPTPWSTEQFTNLFSGRAFGTWYLNTILVSVASTVIALVCAALAGYALARLKFRGSESFTVTILLTYVMPGALLFIPLYRMMSGIGLNDSLWALVLAYPTFTLPFATWLLVGYFKSIPADLEEAALVDGCTRFGAFLRIVLPLAKPGLLAVALFTLTNAWNEFLFAFVFITSDHLKTLPVGLQLLVFGDIYPWGRLMAASLLMAVPVVCVYIYAQRYLVEGITAGSVKG